MASFGDRVVDTVRGYDLLNMPEHGGTCLIYKARKQELFRIEFRDLESKQEGLAMQRELDNTKNLGTNPNIVQRKDFQVTKDGKGMVVYEYCNEGNLLDYLEEREKFNNEELRELISQISNGMRGMWMFNIIHRNINPKSIFVHKSDEQKIAYKLGGFQKSRIFEESGSIIRIPKNLDFVYLAPEVVKAHARERFNYNPNSDIFGFGSVCLYALTKENPWLRADLLNAEEEAFDRKVQEKIPKEVPLEIRELLTKMLRFNPDKRMTKEEFLENEMKMNGPRPFLMDRNTHVKFLVDTGAEQSLYPKGEVSESMETEESAIAEVAVEEGSLVTANGEPIKIYGKQRKALELDGVGHVNWCFVIADVTDPILGADFLQQHKLSVDFGGAK